MQTPVTILPLPASKLNTKGVVFSSSFGSTVVVVLLQVASEPWPSAKTLTLKLPKEETATISAVIKGNNKLSFTNFI